MRVTLVQPPNGVYDAFDLAPPLGLLTIAAVAEQDGNAVAIVDFNLQCIRNPQWLVDFYSNALQAIADTNPDVVGFTSMAVESHVCLELAHLVKLADPHVVTVMGGPHFGSIAKEVLELYPWVDFVVAGEGEGTTCALLRFLRGDATELESVNVARRRKGGIDLNRVNKPLDSLGQLPFPAYHLVDLPLYFQTNPARMLNYESGRGCIYACGFCYSPKHWGQGEQRKDAERVVGEVLRLRELGAHHLFFVQDNFVNSKAGTKVLCEELAAAATGTTWNCYATLPQLTPEIIECLAKAGCREVFVGVDAISATAKEAFAKYFYKGWASLDKQLRTCLDHGITPTCAFMIDPPERDTTNTDAALNTALFARNLNCGNRLNTLTIYNQTESANQLRDRPKTYTELKPRLLLDTPEVVCDNSYARDNPELFPFHHIHLEPSFYRRFVTGIHAAYTLFTSFPRTMLQHVLADNGSVWQVLDSLTNELGDLTQLHPRLRRPAEREFFLRIFPRFKSSRQTRGAFELEAAELRLGEMDTHAMVSAKTGNRAFRCKTGEYELLTLPLPPDAYSRVVSGPTDEQDDRSYLLVRQGRKIHYFEADDGATAVVDRITEASRTGGEVQINPELLQELLRIGVLKDISQVPERR